MFIKKTKKCYWEVCFERTQKRTAVSLRGCQVKKRRIRPEIKHALAQTKTPWRQLSALARRWGLSRSIDWGFF